MKISSGPAPTKIMLVPLLSNFDAIDISEADQSQQLYIHGVQLDFDINVKTCIRFFEVFEWQFE